jgi:hypothetical protein
MENSLWTGDVQRDMCRVLSSKNTLILEDFIKYYQLQKYMRGKLEQHHIFRGYYNSPWAAKTLTAAVEACFANLAGSNADYKIAKYETLYAAVRVRMMWLNGETK